MNYSLDELIDIPKLQALLDTLDEIHSLPSAIIDTAGKIHTATAWQDICTKFHRANPESEKICRESDAYLASQLEKRVAQVAYKCPFGLVDTATPVVVEGRHLCNVFTGQLFTEKPDENQFVRQARAYGFDEEAYLEALRKVPVISEERLRKNLKFLGEFAGMLATQGLIHKRQLETEMALRESEKRQRAILKSSIDGFWLTDAEGRLLEVNETYARMSGYGVEALLSMRISDLEAAEVREETVARMQRIVAQGEDRFESRHRRRDGSVFEVEVSVQYQPTEDGRCVVFIKDITERKRSERLLRLEHAISRCIANADDTSFALKEVMRAVCETMGWGRGTYWRVDEAADVLRFSEFWNVPQYELERYTEGSREVTFARGAGLVGRVWQSGEAIWISDFGTDPRVVQRILAKETGMRGALAFPVVLKDQVLGVLAFLSREVREPDERLVALTQVIGRELGQFLQRKQAEANLRESEAKHRILLDESSDPIFVFYPNGEYRYANPAFAHGIGKKVEDVVGKSVWDVFTKEEADRRFGIVKSVVESKQTKVIEFNVPRPDGDHCYMTTVQPVLDAQGQVISVICFSKDITERMQSEKARAQLEAQLRESQKMEALGTLAGGVAHDFNNVLASIIGNVELAREDVGSDHPALVSLDEISKASRRARDLVQQILAFGRRQQLERKPMSLALVVVETARLVRATLPAMVSLSVDCKGDTPPVLADATAVKQMLLNLCANASQVVRDQARPGMIEVRLEACTQGEARGSLRPGRYACLVVRDNGPGMDEAVRSRIFEPFFTTKLAGEGTGLGLSVVHGMAEAHEASIEVDSAPGKGSEFRIYFPAVEAPVADPIAPTPAAAPVHGMGKRVLYLDDEEAIIFLMKRLLERKGYSVTGYTDPRKALEAVRADPGEFDLAVTDYYMPGMSGLEVAQALKDIRPDLPVVMASGYISEDLRAKAPAVGIRELIYKPNTVEDLCEAVARFANAQSGNDKRP